MTQPAEPAADGTDSAAAAVAPSASCPRCGALIFLDQSFCEACGGELSPTVAPPAATEAGRESPITLSSPVRPAGVVQPQPGPTQRPCQSCGGVVAPDGYCETCGSKAVSERDHYTEQPSDWVAACCDRGIRHHRNEDATAVASDLAAGSRAVLVVCDGVSTSTDSDVASLAGARAARDVLVGSQPAGMGLPASRAAATASAIEAAAAGANAAVVDSTATDSANAASCTFAAAVIDQHLITFGNVGDSRVYWIPDVGEPESARELSRDDSVAQMRISAGVPREEAEHGPQAHAITKWLGRDSPDFSPRTGSVTVASTGWLLVCSDGLWNYCSEADDVQALMGDLNGATEAPLPLAEALVAWACDQGGKDNVSVALARHRGPAPDDATVQSPQSASTDGGPAQSHPVQSQPQPAQTQPPQTPTARAQAVWPPKIASAAPDRQGS
ncbi:MAG TPA: protein phosphatase 2C domain-containing protein [Propionibacteriaceae bacterium]|nr:protein phosphatase 2C domain-containing protein [Propionibacteriaceae bacterium]